MPPDVSNTWNANSLQTQAAILAYDQIRQYEEAEEFGTLMKVIAGTPRL